MVMLHISYKDGCAYVAIDEDGKRRQHKTIYKNTDGKEQHAFCAEVADKVEAELGKPVQWKMAEKSQFKPSTLMIVGISALAIGIMFSLTSAILNAVLPSSSHRSSSSSYASSSSSKLTDAQEEMLAELKLVQPTEVHFESNSSYTVCAGTVTNKSDKYHRFIQVKGEFMDEDGNTIDTAWTYACGDEGLGPGESSKFTMSVARDSRITNVRCYTYDYQ